MYQINYRYFVEHKFLPELILGDNGPNAIITILQSTGEFFTSLYNSLHENEKDYRCPYSGVNGFLCEWDKNGAHLNYGGYVPEKLLSVILSK